MEKYFNRNYTIKHIDYTSQNMYHLCIHIYSAYVQGAS